MYYGEKFNALTHLAAAAAALAGAVVLVVLVVLAALNGDPWKVVSVTIYGVTNAVCDMFATALTGAIRGASLQRGGSLLALAKTNHAAMWN
jgi:hemolysin III